MEPTARAARSPSAATPTPGSLGRRSAVGFRIVLAGLTALAALLVESAGATAQTTRQDEVARLEQNVPNPFTPGFSQTIIAYRLERRARVRLTVYNRLAQDVAVLVDRVEGPGRYVVTWEGIGANGEPVPQGVYWYDLQVDGQRVALRQMRVLESELPPADEEARPLESSRSPIAAIMESGRAIVRSFRTWSASPR
ncbi:MAG: hypothetical protein KY397_00400 [Gemmatimonadetes bacterium]|nr:hypothetical protein [Gemmatimonadota bacterium]